MFAQRQRDRRRGRGRPALRGAFFGCAYSNPRGRGWCSGGDRRGCEHKLASQDWSDRDPKANRDAYQAFAQLIERYPNSKYAADASERMAKLVDALGGNEIAVARYYMKRGAYLAAVNRAQKIVERYQNTRFVEESLAIMESSYRKMDKPQLADDTRRILAQNFPNSPYLTKSWSDNNIPWWRYWK